MPDATPLFPAGLLHLTPTILFGAGTLSAIGGEVAALGRRALIVTDPVIVTTDGFRRALESIQGAGVTTTVFDRTPADLPLDAVEECVRLGYGPAGSAVDVVVGIGGGSSLDLAKIASLQLAHPGALEDRYGEGNVPGPVLPIVSVPTTAGTGSEVTTVAVVNDPRRSLKVGISDHHLLPTVAICDPELTLTCPPSVSAHAGIDALVHAVESYLAPPRPIAWAEPDREVFRGGTALTDLFAREAMRLISGSLEKVVVDGTDLEARTAMHLGSLLAGIAFGHAGTAAAHALQYPIGGATHTPHGLGTGLLLPYVLAYVAEDARERLADVAGALGVAGSGGGGGDAAAAITELRRICAAIGIPATLEELGIPRGDLRDHAGQAATITRLLKNSPVALGADELFEVLEDAWTRDCRTRRSTGFLMACGPRTNARLTSCRTGRTCSSPPIWRPPSASRSAAPRRSCRRTSASTTRAPVSSSRAP